MTAGLKPCALPCKYRGHALARCWSREWCALRDHVQVLKRAGYSDSDIAKYSVTPGVPLLPDAYVGDPKAFERWAKAGELFATVGSFFSKRK